jgi:hypothetical protein
VPKLNKKRSATPRVRQAIPARKVADPPGESFHDLVNAAARWSARHDLLKLARKAFHSPLNDLPAGQIELTVERQCVVFATADHESHSFAVEFALTDKKTGLEIGAWHFHHAPECDAVDFVPHPQNWQKLKKLYGGDRFDRLF